MAFRCHIQAEASRVARSTKPFGAPLLPEEPRSTKAKASGACPDKSERVETDLHAFGNSIRWAGETTVGEL